MGDEMEIKIHSLSKQNDEMDQKMESMEVLLNARANHAELQNSVEILIAEKKHQKKAHQNLLNELDRKEKEFENLKIENYKIQNKVKKIEEENEELMLRLKIMEIDGRLKEMEILLRHKQSNDALQNNMDTLKDECDALQSKSDKMKIKNYKKNMNVIDNVVPKKKMKKLNDSMCWN